MRALLMLLSLAAGCAKAPVLGAVNFESESTQIANPADQQIIDEAAAILQSTDWSVVVVGLTDTEGDKESNLKLSLARAEAVASQLRNKTKVKESRIVVHGMGERLATGESLRERKVEFVFFKDKGKPIREVVLESGVLDADIERSEEAKEGKAGKAD
jgi:hypothetical protein